MLPTLLVYSEQSTPRLQYIVSQLQYILTINVTLTHNWDAYCQHQALRLAYVTHLPQGAPNGWHIVPTDILWEKNIQKQPLQLDSWQSLTTLFNHYKAEIPFDILAASFYLLSRYEEYLPHRKDSYGRYAHTESIAYKQQFLHQPLVQLWWLAMLQLAVAKGWGKPYEQVLAALPNTYQWLPTYDIDIAFAYKHKPLWLQMANALRHWRSGKLAYWWQQHQALVDVYAEPCYWLQQLHTQHQLPAIHFWLVASHRSRYDKNIAPSSKAMQRLIQNTVTQHGLHPSWQAAQQAPLVATERNALRQIVKQSVTISRQHYIAQTLPINYRWWVQAGIQTDYSMGYGSINGFRASIAKTYDFFDVLENQTLPIQVVPFSYMDANAIFEEKLSTTAAMQQAAAQQQLVQQVGGTWVTIAHNHFLTATAEYMPWRNLYKEMLQTFGG
ncbi:MAG TPA: hypothetical protein DCL43_01880 [Chitinophagaceae bacterium]|nr:hypothetical protein [Chitinophagaceae bacterium]